MAFTRATGKHRRPKQPSRIRRAGAGAAGIAGLTAAGVVGTLASPALASDGDQSGEAHDTGLIRALEAQGDNLAQTMHEQAIVQETAELQAEAETAAKAEAAKIKAAAERKAAEAKRKAAAEKARQKAAQAREKAEKERAAKQQAKAAASRSAPRESAAPAPASGGYVLPVDGSYVSTGYKVGGGMWSSGSHTGVDFHAGMNTPVKSVAAGEVVEAGNGGAYGNNIVIKHKDGTYTQYGHLNSIGVSVGQSVTAGQQIGLSGSTGNSSGPHLHFEARTGPDYGSDIDPVAYLRQHGVSV
ncbi:M23 family metallopeptidase [Streptomyces boncukensis]|uniref:M23 family metallopeptidase n=1 Tax=Streptomyces boncukensis TaxID=2711219 RepID=A0A6G4X2B6_9ACTN|nr:M23 family metallopeptidase [Streptomyces boncukensis]NGO71686.1 M23 family metallopeptidase [Streptomyces boncukensis]